MTEFKTVVESFRSDLKKVVEVVTHTNDKVTRMEKDLKSVKEDVEILKIDVHILKKDVQGLKTDVHALKADVHTLKTDVHSVKEQAGLLMEGQTEIRAELKNCATRREFASLDKRVTRLERKMA